MNIVIVDYWGATIDTLTSDSVPRKGDWVKDFRVTCVQWEPGPVVFLSDDGLGRVEFTKRYKKYRAPNRGK